MATTKNITVNRPNPGADPVPVTLTATIKKGSEQIVQAFTLNVAPFTNAEVVSKVHDALTEASILGTNTSLTSVIADLVLPTSGANGSTISWTSSTPSFLDTTGRVIRPSYTQGSVNVTLEATIKSGSEQATKQFNVIVYRLEQTTTEYLEATWTSISPSILNGNPDINDITANLYVPTPSGVSVSMSSSSPTVITNTGSVTRPISTQPNASVTLTFTLTKDGTSITKIMNVVVLHA